jgi:hypothetical protein
MIIQFMVSLGDDHLMHDHSLHDHSLHDHSMLDALNVIKTMSLAWLGIGIVQKVAKG